MSRERVAGQRGFQSLGLRGLGAFACLGFRAEGFDVWDEASGIRVFGFGVFTLYPIATLRTVNPKPYRAPDMTLLGLRVY